MFLLIFLFAGCTKSSKETVKNDKLKVVTTTSIITDVVSQVAGDRVEITGLIGYGQDPHAYQPTPRDMALTEEADIIFVNGFGLEENLLETLKSNNEDSITEVSKGIVPLEFGGHEEEEHDHEAEEEEHHHHAGTDPHTWMSPLNVMIWTDNIAEALAEADPVNADYYRKNAAAYKEELKALHGDIESGLASLPEERRVLVTDHQCFGYFARDYHFRIAGTIIPGLSTNAEPSAKDLTDLINMLETEQVPAIFIGMTSGDGVKKLGEVIREELGYPIKIQMMLTGSLQPAGEPGGSYLGFIRYNSGQIMEGLK